MSKLPIPPRRQAPSSWTAALDRARADVAAGRTEDATTILKRLESEDARPPATDYKPRRAV